MYVCMFVCVYICMYASMYICMYIEGFTGVKYRSLRDRIKRSHSHEIAIRKLVISRTDEAIEAARLFVFLCTLCCNV